MDAPAPAQTAEFMDMMRGMTDKHGMTPDVFAALVFDAVERGEYWIVPQPEMLDTGLRDRTEMILERRLPTSSGLIDEDRKQHG